MKNICIKHQITPEELDSIIHKLLDHVPNDALDEKEIDVVFDLLRNGDVEPPEGLGEMDIICFKAINIAMASMDCKNCIAQFKCKQRDGKNSLCDCVTNFMYVAQALPSPGVNGNLAITREEYVDVITKTPIEVVVKEAEDGEED